MPRDGAQEEVGITIESAIAHPCHHSDPDSTAVCKAGPSGYSPAGTAGLRMPVIRVPVGMAAGSG